MHPLDPPLVITPGPEPAYCPRCELRHTRRPDWLCPRCGSPVDTEVPAPRTPVPASQLEPPFPLGTRLAGAILVLTSGVLAFPVVRRLATLPAGGYRWRLLVTVTALAGLGLTLLLKSSSARWAAVFFAAVAAVVLAEGLLRVVLPGLVADPLPGPARQVLRDLIRDHHPRRLLLLLGFDGGCLLLLAGRPRAARMIAGLLLVAPLLAVELVAALGR
jgi:hypothetical protein